VSVGSAEIESFGRRIRGPSALGGDRVRFLHLTWTLAVTEFKLRFFGSVLGYLWQLMRPLMLFGVLYFVFTEFVRIGGTAPHFAVVLLLGIVIFTFFAESTGGAVSSLVDRENLVRKIHFPRLVIPLAVVLTAYFNLLLNLIVVFVFALAQGISPRWSWLELPAMMLVLGVWAVGISMLISALYVRARDVKPIWEVVVQAMFYASPVIYPIERIPNRKWEAPVMCNPLATIIEQARHAVVDPTAPSAADAIGAPSRLLIPAGVILVSVVLGFWLFNREAPRIAEQL
jgi:ABC-2 type transport system permease protein